MMSPAPRHGWAEQLQAADGWLVASVPALPGCHAQARSLDKLMLRVREAIELCLEVEKPSPSQFVGVQKVTVTL